MSATRTDAGTTLVRTSTDYVALFTIKDGLPAGTTEYLDAVAPVQGPG